MKSDPQVYGSNEEFVAVKRLGKVENGWRKVAFKRQRCFWKSNRSNSKGWGKQQEYLSSLLFFALHKYNMCCPRKGEMTCGGGGTLFSREKRSIFCSRWSQKAYQIIPPQWGYSGTIKHYFYALYAVYHQIVKRRCYETIFCFHDSLLSGNIYEYFYGLCECKPYCRPQDRYNTVGFRLVAELK